MKPKGGASLMTPGALVTFKEKLIPLAKVVTPNRQEAERLSGVKVRTLKDAEEAAEEISRLGVEAVVIKGGHIDTPEESVDLLYEDSQVKTYRLPRLDSKLTHGAGCSFSAAITGLLAKGFDIKEAVERAKRIVFDAIRHGFDVGKGYGSVNPLAELHLKSEKYAVIMALEEALEKLNTRDEFFELMPEVRMNFVYALPRAIDIKEVAGFPGRITFDGKQLASVSRPRFGVSTHVAKTIITVMKSFPDIRSALNIKYERDLVDASVKLGLNVLNYDRRLEPEKIRRTEGASIPWGVEQALKELDLRPDIIFHLGDIGKEPMITVLAETPREVLKKVVKVLKNR